MQQQLVTCLLILPGVRPTSTSQKDGALQRTRKARPRQGALGNNFVVLENFDKDILNKMLARKAKKVGDVVLVNGKPAIIKKRVLKSPPLLTENIKKKRIRMRVRPTFPRRARAQSPMLRKVRKLRLKYEE